MNLQESFKKNIVHYHLFTTKDRLLLAVSGGIDSVVLCELCRQSDFSFIIAHCNFQLRGAESERDEDFVRSLGKKYGVEVLVKKFDTEKYAAIHKKSIQVAARELRYTWFEELITTEKKAAYLLTAHHADDNAETVTMNFFRGTGLHGLTGIPRSAGIIRRPLLDFSRNELVAFANANQLEHVKDSSNESSKYTRNLFRNEILPLVEKAYPQAKDNLLDNISRFKEIERLYKMATAELKEKLCRKKGVEVHIPVKQLLSYQNKALIYEIISEYGFTEKQVEEVLKLAESESGRFVQSTSAFRIIKHRHWFIITPPATAEASMIVIDANDSNVQFDAGQLAFETKPAGKLSTDPSRNIALLDADHIEFPLILRKWKQGDYFYPLGMKKKKKLSRFFIDQKLSRPDKEKVWVLEMNKKITWVVGMRIDERYKVGEKTEKVMKVTWKNNDPIAIG
jgi:tRNA(Ile)-lysidine synthase